MGTALFAIAIVKSKKVIHVSNQVIPRSTPLKVLSSSALSFKMADKSFTNDWPCYLFYRKDLVTK